MCSPPTICCLNFSFMGGVAKKWITKHGCENYFCSLTYWAPMEKCLLTCMALYQTLKYWCTLMWSCTTPHTPQFFRVSKLLHHFFPCLLHDLFRLQNSKWSNFIEEIGWMDTFVGAGSLWHIGPDIPFFETLSQNGRYWSTVILGAKIYKISTSNYGKLYYVVNCLLSGQGKKIKTHHHHHHRHHWSSEICFLRPWIFTVFLHTFFLFFGQFFWSVSYSFDNMLQYCHKLNAGFCLGWSLTNTTSDNWLKKMHWFKRYYGFIPFIFIYFYLIMYLLCLEGFSIT